MTQYAMLPNIVEHSFQVMRVSLAMADNLRDDVEISRGMVLAAALLHDITKTRSLKTRERHDTSGGVLLRELGFPSIAEIVEQHVYIEDVKQEGALEEKEIVFYADKRVMHDQIVTLDERLRDLVQRYGMTQEISNRILKNKSLILAVESKISRHMKVDVHEAIDNLKNSRLRKGHRA